MAVSKYCKLMSDLSTRQLPEEQDRKKKSREHGLLQSGTTLQGRYRIEGARGVGGFSSVYQARDLHFPNVVRLCAIKEMVHTSHDPRVRQMTTDSFEREASILATLDHPAIPEVYDFFTERDRSYLVLEYIHGEDLEDKLSKATGMFPTEQVFEWSLQLCDVLAYLHTHKPHPVIFRDLKPSNVMLDRYERIRLIDFNIAKIFQSGVKGTMIGTEGYSPPEQYRGESSPGGDVYALGATLHHVLTRQDPRQEPPFSFAERPIEDTNPQVPKPFQAIIDRCLAYNVADRFADGAEVKRALLDLVPLINTGGFRGQISTQTVGGELTFTGSTGSADLGGPTPLWQFRCEDEIRSTPAVVDNRVYVGAYDNNLYALEASSGEFAWKYPASDGIASSPHVYKELIFIGSSDNSLYAINLNNGELKWQYKTEGPVHSSPRADFDHVFFGSDDGHLYALNVTSGREVWRVNAHSMVRSTPLVQDDRIFYGTNGGYVFCVDLSGKVKWQFRARRTVTSSPVIFEDIVIIGSMDYTVYAVDANSGWAIWRFRTGKPVVSTAAISDKRAFVGSSDGILYALDIFSGRLAWKYETEGQINSSPAIWGNAVYFGSTDGHVYCLDTKQGKLIWRYRTEGVVVGSPIVAEDIVFIGSCDHHLYALPA